MDGIGVALQVSGREEVEVVEVVTESRDRVGDGCLEGERGGDQLCVLTLQLQ